MNSKKMNKETVKQRVMEILMGGAGIGLLIFFISDGLLAAAIAAVFGITIAAINLK